MRLFERTIFRKLFLQMSVLILGIIFITVTIISVYYGGLLIDRVRRGLYELCANGDIQLQSQITNMEKLALYVSTNADVSNSFVCAKKLTEKDFGLYQKNSMIINSIMVPESNSEYRISLYNGDTGNFISFGRPIDKKKVTDTLNAPDYKVFYQEAVGDNARIKFTPDPWMEDGEVHIRIFRTIYNPDILGEAVGIVEVSLPVSNLAITNWASSCLITDEGLIYGNPRILNRNFIRMAVETSQGWEIVSGQKKISIFSAVGYMVILMIFLGLLFLLFSYLILYKVLERIVEPLNSLTDRINEITLNNLQIPGNMTEGSINEVENLKFAFDHMLKNLQISIQEAMDAKTYEMQANYIALQAQMDPHFLYNMLTVIRIFTKEGDLESTTRMCDYLSDMLRYISNYKNDMVYACQEVEHAKNYMKLMKYRYEDGFDYEIHLSPDFIESRISIPRLCLSPMVENAFSHAFKKSIPPWRIMVKGYVDQGRWILEVQDNGCGMNEMEIHELMQKIDDFSKDISSNIGKLKLGGMGLINMVARLRIKYKEDLIFRIETKELEGTVFMIGGIIR